MGFVVLKVGILVFESWLCHLQAVREGENLKNHLTAMSTNNKCKMLHAGILCKMLHNVRFLAAFRIFRHLGYLRLAIFFLLPPFDLGSCWGRTRGS